MNNLPFGTTVVCHDAGGANVVVAALKATGRKDWRACMMGPALKIWNAAFPGVSSHERVQDVLVGTPLLITGTGWSSDLEHDARRCAALSGIYTIAVLDHWVNYPERFVRDGEVVYPDEFWVTDAEALRIASACFPGAKITLARNHYVEAQLARIESVHLPDEPELLYVLEPMRDDWGRGVPGEFQALDYLVSHLSVLDLPPNTKIRLRPHPSEQDGKYSHWLSARSADYFVLDRSADIYMAMGRSAWVAGCESFALVLALMARRQVFCTLPPWAPPSQLPPLGIVNLADLIRDKARVRGQATTR